MANVRLSIALGDARIDIEEANTDRLGPSMAYGAPVDFDRLKEPLPSLIASAVVRASNAAGIDLRDVMRSIEHHASR